MYTLETLTLVYTAVHLTIRHIHTRDTRTCTAVHVKRHIHIWNTQTCSIFNVSYSGGVITSLEIYPIWLKSLAHCCFRSVLSSQWEVITVISRSSSRPGQRQRSRSGGWHPEFRSFRRLRAGRYGQLATMLRSRPGDRQPPDAIELPDGPGPRGFWPRTAGIG